MTSMISSRRIELIRFRKSTFAAVYDSYSPCDLEIDPLLSSNPGFSFQKDMIWNVHKLYNEIRQLKSLSIEEVYSTLGIDLEATDSVKCVHRRNHIKGYREEIAKILEVSIQQLHKNVDRVDITKITHRIFHSMQPFTTSKPFYVASQWFIGNSIERNENMREAFEHYSLSTSAQKCDTKFCLDALTKLLQCTKNQVLNSFRTLYLDNLLDHMYQWYFIHSESSYDFLIFMPDAFDDVRDYLLDIIDNNPFAYYIKYNGCSIEKINEDECCLDADSILCLSMDVVNQLPSIRELSRKITQFYQSYRNFCEYGVFDCHCYNITEHVSRTMLRSNDSETVIPLLIEKLIENEEITPVISYKSIISPKNTFTQKVVRRDLINMLQESKHHAYRELKQQTLFDISDLKAG